MLCKNGVVTTHPNSTGIFFICQTIAKGNHCRFVRYCNRTKEFVMITDKNGNTCSDYDADLSKI